MVGFFLCLLIYKNIQKLRGFNFCMTKHIVVLLIMDMKEAKFDVNGRKGKICFWLLCVRK